MCGMWWDQLGRTASKALEDLSGKGREMTVLESPLCASCASPYVRGEEVSCPSPLPGSWLRHP